MTKKIKEFKERRKFARADVYAVARYFCSLRDREVGLQARISDISEGGASLVTFMEGIPMEASVKISFVIPGETGPLVAVEGKVKHTGILERDLYRSGVEFLKVKKKDLQAIRGYVTSHKRK
ncbi:MAG: hypothetical protein A2351_05945 [Omnitrophica bacterium RIFOXYB12_FULL_50_7]|nr:MAG: hypothetical protein A2351_05945 [Omnitrophica bacterium RIFOXYB12_FULL_50_7]